jgi:DNA-binding response OmpR family regulator
VPARFLEDLSAFGPDLVIMDVVLPGTSGYELVRLLQAQGPAVPVLLLTTAPTPSGDPPGAQDILRKPVEPAKLLAEVRRRLARTEAVMPS